MKKQFPALSLALLLTAMLTVTGLAAGTQFEVRSPGQPVSAGEEFTVTVELAGNPGFASVEYILSYDRGDMECVTISSGPVLEGALFGSNPNFRAGAIVGAASAYNLQGNGVVASYTFLALKDLDTFDFALEDILLHTENDEPIPYTVTGAREVNIPSDSPDSGTGAGQTGSPGNGTESAQTGASGRGTGGGETQNSEEIPHLFPDTAGNWAEESINQAVEHGLFSGYQDGTFRPENRLSRAAFMKVLWNLAGRPEAAQNAPFADIAGWDEDIQSAITWAWQEHYIDGTSPTTFSPGEALTRQASMKILFNYNGGESGIERMFTSIYDGIFEDSALIADWAKPGMYWSVYHEIIRGTTSSTLSPGGYITRAQLAVIMVRYTNRYPSA